MSASTMALTESPSAPLAHSVDDAVVRCLGLTKIFKDFWFRPRVRAVDGIDLEIQRGQVFGLLGPNGSGKSTTIKMILGLLNPSRGRIMVFGKRPEDVSTKKLIGYLPEESYLYRFLNARETLDYYGQLFHQSRGQRQRRIDMLLEMVGLDAVQRRPVGEYSKGMQRRIGLAQALINDPQLLILDEPTTGLDPIGTRQIKDLILELARRGKTILLCSHLLGDVEDVCQRVAIMYGGKVRAQGTVDELLVKQGMTTISTPELDSQTLQEIDLLLQKHGKQIDRVERPRQKLESLFLEIVQKAQAEGVGTSGARSGGAIAQFLRAEAPEEAQGQAVIEQLIKAPAPAPAADAPVAQQTTPASAATGVSQKQIIENLIVPAPASAPASPAAPAPAQPAAAPVDRSVIDSLLKPGDSAAAADPKKKP